MVIWQFELSEREAQPLEYIYIYEENVDAQET